MTLREQFGLPIDASFNQNQYLTGRFHAHPEYEIYYFHGGGCTYLIGGRMFELAPGDLIIMHGMTLHAPIVDPRRPYERTVVQFDPAIAAGLLRPPFQADVLAPFRDLGNARVRLAGERRERIEELLAEMCELYRRDDAVSCNRFLIAFLRLLHDICECFGGTAPTPVPFHPRVQADHGADAGGVPPFAARRRLTPPVPLAPSVPPVRHVQSGYRSVRRSRHVVTEPPARTSSSSRRSRSAVMIISSPISPSARMPRGGNGTSFGVMIAAWP